MGEPAFESPPAASELDPDRVIDSNRRTRGDRLTTERTGGETR
ncbi:hypothetical protein AB7C87_13500 [Natrarchaeobius sp. A-rgal3]